MKVIIIGAGLTGLSAAESIGDRAEVQIFEKNYMAGGLARTSELGGFRRDYTGHFLHFHNEKIKKKVLSFFEKGELLEIKRKSFIYTHKTFVPYPFQAHINYLQKDLKRECLTGFLENLKSENKSDDNNFYKWMLNQYGKGIVKFFMLPYNQKMWTVHPRELTMEWMSRFVPRPSPEEIISGTVSEGKKDEGYNATFYYPKKGIGELVEKFTQKISNIEIESKVDKVNWKKKTISINGERHDYNCLITTCPLKDFILNILEPVDENLVNYAKKLRYNSVLNITIGWEGALGNKLPEGTHWLYFPEKELDFYRVGFYSALSPGMCPEGKYSCYVEITYKEGKLPPKNEYRNIEKKVVDQLMKINIIPSDVKIIQIPVQPINTAYIIYDKNWNESRNYILNWLQERDILSGGRYGGWEYSAMEDAILWGERLAKKCLSK